VAAWKNNNKNVSNGARAIAIFWLIFIIVIITIFIVRREPILKNINLLISRLTGSIITGEEFLEYEEEITEVVIGQQPQHSVQPPQTHTPEVMPEVTSEVTPPEAPVTEPSASDPPAVPPPAQPPAAQPVTPPVPSPPAPAVQTRDRAIYFIQVSNDGQVFQTRVTRRLPVTQSPMTDALNVMLAGPSAEELSRGIVNFIPKNTKILSAAIRGTTAYLNFSEDFLFNTLGVEGYIAQLRQIVWTVTEFSNVNDVQILVDGRRLDYLGEGIWIGSPISRQSF